MWCHSLSKVIDPLKSRCLCFSVPAPSESEIFSYIYKINIAEKMYLSYNKLCNISFRAQGNIKKALWILQSINAKYDGLTEYDKSLVYLVELISTYKLENMQEIRNILYNIMITNIDGTNIISDITYNLINKDFPEYIKCKIINLAAKYDHNIVRGRREIIHLEGFVSGIMCILYENNKNIKQILFIKKKIEII